MPLSEATCVGLRLGTAGECSLRHDFAACPKVQMEDDIASAVSRAGLVARRAKAAAYKLRSIASTACSSADDAVHRGLDRQTERTWPGPTTSSNYELLAADQVAPSWTGSPSSTI